MSTDKTHIADMQMRAGKAGAALPWGLSENEPWLAGYGLVQVVVILFIALGHTSTLPFGPHYPEALRHFGYDPSWFGVNVLFILAGFMALRSLHRHGSGLRLLISRLKRTFPYLVIYAILIVCIVFPLLGKPPGSFAQTAKHLAMYALDVVACIDPGRVLPGLLDEANYMCVIQGAIWTFRWGLAAFVGVTVVWHIGLLHDRRKVLALAALGICAYVSIYGAQLWGRFYFPEQLQPGVRLGAMFAIGMAIFAYRAEIFRVRALSVVIFLAAIVQYKALPWTPMIEIFVSVFWALLAFTVMQSRLLSKLKTVKVQGLAAALYIFHWPVAQLILTVRPHAGSWELIAIALPVALLFSIVVSRLTSRLMAFGKQLATSPQTETAESAS